jgi:hypothetical protein
MKRKFSHIPVQIADGLLCDVGAWVQRISAQDKDLHRGRFSRHAIFQARDLRDTSGSSSVKTFNFGSIWTFIIFNDSRRSELG